MLIGLSGLIGVGKDTVADKLRDQRFHVVSFADPLKRFVRDVFDFTPESLWGASELRNKEDTRYPRQDGGFLSPRHALQLLGTEWGRHCYEDVWLDYALRTARDLLKNAGNCTYERERGVVLLPAIVPVSYGVVFPDCRFKNEFAKVRAAGGKLVRIRRPGYDNPAFKHQSEEEQLSLPDSYFDHVLQNDGELSDLDGKIASMLYELRSGA